MRADVLEIGHVAHVDPRLRRRDHDIGAPEAERRQHHELGLDVGDMLAHEILAGHADMRRPRGQLPDDLGRGQEGDLHPVEPRDGAAIIAHAAPLHDLQPRAREIFVGVFLQAPLRGHGNGERHGAASTVSRSSQIAAPTAGVACEAPSLRASPS